LFGSTTAFLPSSFLADIPAELLQTEGAERASGGFIAGGFRGLGSSTPTPSSRPKTSITGAIREVRDNSSLQLAVGDRIKHADYGEGTVASTRGEGPKQVAEVKFDEGATKSLVVKIAPIEKL
jgi:DNA helicase-2/ATP-dependent DNA helicase PcrA